MPMIDAPARRWPAHWFRLMTPRAYTAQNSCTENLDITRVNVTELRCHPPSYLQQVQNGEEIEITIHNKVIARLSPVEDRQTVQSALNLSSIASNCCADSFNAISTAADRLEFWLAIL